MSARRKPSDKLSTARLSRRPPARTRLKSSDLRGGGPSPIRMWLTSPLFKRLCGIALIGFSLYGSVVWIGNHVPPWFRTTLHGLGFSVHHVVTQGRDKTSKQDLWFALSTLPGSALLKLNLDQVRRRVEALPWVSQAAISRIYPQTLHIRLVERKPLALWQQNGKKILIDQSGTVIQCAPSDYPQNLITVVGEGAPDATASLLNSLKAFPDIQKRLSAAVFLRSGRWNLHLDHRCVLKLPEAGLAHALTRFLKLENLLPHSPQITNHSIDLRFGDRIVIHALTPQPQAKIHSPPASTKAV